jgi:hypothetical protein
MIAVVQQALRLRIRNKSEDPPVLANFQCAQCLHTSSTACHLSTYESNPSRHPFAISLIPVQNPTTM